MNEHVRYEVKRPENLLNFSTSSRLPVIIQNEIAECGLACIAMVAGFHGYETDLLNLRRKFSISSHGSSVKDLVSIAGRLHFSARALKSETEDLKYIQLPCILHWGLNHFVVLKQIKKNKYVLHDPAYGQHVIDAETFNNQFTGVLLELIPTPAFQKKKEVQLLNIKHFWSRIVGFKRSIGQVLILSLLLQLFGIASPFYMQTIVDDVLLRADSNLLIVLAIGFGMLALIQVGTNVIRSFVILNLSNRLNMQMSANLFRHLIRLPMEYFAKRHMGDIISRFDSLDYVRNLLTNGLVSAIVDGAMAVITLAAMFFYDVKLTFIVLFIVLLYAVLRWAMFQPTKSLTQESIIASAKEKTHFMESMRAIQTIKLFQREDDRQNQWQNRLATMMNKQIQLARWGIGFSALNGILFAVENILVIYFAATSVMDNAISLGMFYAFISYKSNFISTMDRLLTQWLSFKMLALYMNRLSDIAFTEPENIEQHVIINEYEVPLADTENSIQEYISTNSKNSIVGKIEVKNLAYRYGENERAVFQNINFVIYPGEAVAIVGASGCGKTTLLKCLMGLIQPTEGEILIDDKPLKKVPNYRSRIACVMQDDQLLSGDMSENISFFSTVVNMPKIHKYAKMAGIHKEILQMPMNYHTLVGDMGSSLSGGQKQRVILARALYREPSILFLDEATSHLDIGNEALVNANIKELNITRVIVAHRPETINSATRVIEM